MWITITPRLKKGLEILAQLDNVKFRQLVNHICQGLYTGNDKIFSEDEEDKLIMSLNLKKDNLSLLLDTITFIYSQAAFSIIEPAQMESSMNDKFSLSEDKISIFVNAWTTYSKQIIDTLRRKSVFPNRVEDINWSFNIQASSPAHAADNKPVLLLQLNMTGESKPLTVEMDKSSLSDLYENLEKIQSQLDALK
ncbi:COMM domain-containing protein 10 [Microplitis mediator]|uniref:COMM domain-containing protein 10 n=1 Tax=Microplitis mediator TaxID=375433 RepID=UPI002555F055|nr:COMM domain-containing protein 10 [Microplitis mediator]XP_057319583.1 COMM domain-containing protein 10 [Microplitis mediator]XP_057319584.1 COMM domain-containing protein 10 [Microplitis mediator]XP_057319585.1 COMM domain-containing protein 10 [Microplitis mediator]